MTHELISKDSELTSSVEVECGWRAFFKNRGGKSRLEGVVLNPTWFWFWFCCLGCWYAGKRSWSRSRLENCLLRLLLKYGCDEPPDKNPIKKKKVLCVRFFSFYLMQMNFYLIIFKKEEKKITWSSNTTSCRSPHITRISRESISRNHTRSSTKRTYTLYKD